MSSYLKQSTASQSRIVGPFVDETDFKTAETGLTVANTDVKLMKNGAASVNKNSGGGTHRVNGMYSLTFDATDTDTVGELEVSIVVSGALPVFKTFFVLEEAVYDALFAASAPGYLQPTTAGRTLDVSAGGEAGVDWANVGSPTTVVGLSGTTVKTATDVETDTQDIQARLPAALVSGRIDASVGAMAANVLTATALAADAVTEIQSGLATAAALATVDGNVTAIKGKTDNLPIDPADASDLAASFGTVNTKLDTIDDLLDTEVAAIKAKTDNLPTDPADASDIAASFATVNTKLDTVDDFLDTEIAAIKAKTDNLPADPADASDIATAFAAVPAAVWASGTRTLTSFGTLAADVWAVVIENSLTALQMLRLILSAASGKLSGAATTTVRIRDNADTKDRIVATVDANGNRTAVTVDGT